MAPTAKATASMFGYLVDGRWLTEGEPMEVHAPHDGSVVGTVFRAGVEHVEAAIRAAVRTFAETRRMPCYERQGILRKVAAGLAEHREDLARTMALEAGKPIKTARARKLAGSKGAGCLSTCSPRPSADRRSCGVFRWGRSRRLLRSISR